MFEELAAKWTEREKMGDGAIITRMAFHIFVSVCLQDIKGQSWTDEESDGENESEQFLYGIQVPRPS